jgi:hypothetical protein
MYLLNNIADFICTDASIISAFEATPVKGTSVFISLEPDTPDNCITLYPYGGAPPEVNSKYKHNSNVQVRIRADDFQQAYKTGQTIINRMHYNGDVLASTNGMLYTVQSQPIYLNRDDELRSIVVTNFNVKHVI